MVLGSDGVLLRAMVEFQCVMSWVVLLKILYLTNTVQFQIYNIGNTHTCILSHTAVTPLSELQCYFSGVFHVPASIYKCIYVCIVYVPVGVVLWPFSLDVLYLCVCGVFGVLV